VTRYLIDTNILSEPTKLQPNQTVVETLERYEGEISISAVTWHEILFGYNRMPESRRRQSIQQYLTEVVQPNFPILPYTTEAAVWHASERARLSAIGQTPAFQDGQIAATAAVNNLIIVTNNVSDYANFQNLTIENWFTL
jgi:tRNA(fMet)-specific endonuclease VapC